MIEKLKKTIFQVTDTIKDQANSLGDTAKEKSYKLIEEWIENFPKFKEFGFEIRSFALKASLSPSIEAELRAPASEFPRERIETLIKENPGNSSMQSVLKTILTAYDMHEKMGSPPFDTLFVVIRVKVPPEIKVVLGQPMVQ